MTVSTLWGQPSAGMPSGVSADGSGYTMGVQFTVSTAGTLTGIWFYSATGAVGRPSVIGLYQVTGTGTGTLVHSETVSSWSGAAGTGWIRAAFATPPSLSTGVNYKAVIVENDGNFFYSTTSHYWDTGAGLNGITSSSGVITAPNNAGADGGQDTFFNNVSIGYPTTSFNASNYWVDPEVTTASGPTNVNESDVAGAVETLTVSVTLGLTDVAAVLDAVVSGVTVNFQDFGAELELLFAPSGNLKRDAIVFVAATYVGT